MFNLFKKAFGARPHPELSAVNRYRAEFSKMSAEDRQVLCAQLAEAPTPAPDPASVLALASVIADTVFGIEVHQSQLRTALALHDGKFVDLPTGEGKTVAVALAAIVAIRCSNTGSRGVHVATANAYLAERDAAWMAPLYAKLGVTVSVRSHGSVTRETYFADVVYGTLDGYVFDYLQDNVQLLSEAQVQVRPDGSAATRYLIIDEVDQVLIDNAKSPVSISIPGKDESNAWRRLRGVISVLSPADVEIDTAARTAHLTETGMANAESWFLAEGILHDAAHLYLPENLSVLNKLNATVHAEYAYNRGRDYLVEEDHVVLLDSTTGRRIPGGILTNGIWQALQGKENCTITAAPSVIATCAVQNFVSRYTRVAGLSGTAWMAKDELQAVYGIKTEKVDPHHMSTREDRLPKLYRTQESKHHAIVRTAMDRHAEDTPLLIEVSTAEEAEELKLLLATEGLPVSVLSAENHAAEAPILAEAAAPGAITIVTPMAGRGVDIKLGGSCVDSNRVARVKTRGLHIISAMCHETPRQDAQLRGRCGRQGERGVTQHYLSLDDPMIHQFGGESLDAIFDILKVDSDVALSHDLVRKLIARAQGAVSEHLEDLRKAALEFDNVLAEQRNQVYARRGVIMEHPEREAREARYRGIQQMVYTVAPTNSFPEQWDLQNLDTYVKTKLALPGLPHLDYADQAEVISLLCAQSDEKRERLVTQRSEAAVAMRERALQLRALDQHWAQLIAESETLRASTRLRAFANENPKYAFIREAGKLFDHMVTAVDAESYSALLRMDIPEPKPLASRTPNE